MSWTMKATKGEGGGPKAPAGNHPAVLVAIVDMGTQWVDGFQGAPGKYQRRAYFVWELVAEEAGPGRNHVIGVDLTLSFNEKAKLRLWVEAWTGKSIPEGGEFDVASLLGKSCLLNVKDKNGYPRIEGVGAMPKGMQAPPHQFKPVAFQLGSPAAVPADLPDWLPYLYGKPLTEYIAACREIAGEAAKGGVPRASKAAGVGNPEAGAVASAPPPRPAGGPPKAPPRPGAAAPVEFWVALSADGEPVRMTADEMRDALVNTKADLAAVMVCRVGTEKWTTAAEEPLAAMPF